MSGRGQVSVELFLVLSLFVVLILWSMNYTSRFESAMGGASSSLAQRSLGASLAAIADEACVASANVSYRLPCALSGGQPLGLYINSPNASYINVSGSASRYYSACLINGSVYSLCNGTEGDWVCFRGVSGMVYFARGRCA